MGAPLGKPGERLADLLGILKDCKGRLWKQASLSIVPRWVTWRGGVFTMDFGRQ
jgi:hypothetical protein